MVEIRSLSNKPLSNQDCMLLESGRTSTLLVASHLKQKKEAMVNRICTEKLSKERFSVIEKLVTHLFEEMELKRMENSVLLVGIESRSKSSTSDTSSCVSRREPKRIITQYLSKVTKSNQPKPVFLSTMSTDPQESQKKVPSLSINLEQP
jgi:hypothetical protein